MRVVPVPINKATAFLRSIGDASSHQPWLRHFSSAQPSSARVRSLREMPGPRGWPLLGTSLEWLGGNPRRILKMSDVIRKRIDKYGTIYREKLLGQPLQVVIAEPHDVEAVFRADGPFPFRPEPAGDAQSVGRTKTKLPADMFAR